ncbi:putative type 11 methyltransferase [Magnetofaba australis IT-1]|uniref:Putative type 11 methyltransferase n=1 Tax=Magnetofaba australis IT-1 TaxID=1434232 RepID=A0A1Y2K5B6_9PROT|nr:putative type 11 methyltransferase [Magnetofaba australis IT-1]
MPIPDYLQETYWWAYVDPRAVTFFERQWLVNLILWGNFTRLRDLALAVMAPHMDGRSLQIACVYGDFTQRLLAMLPDSGALDVIDVAPVQLRNLRQKLGATPENLTIRQQDSTQLGYADGVMDNTLLFFLLHEQPEATRKQTIAEALRVTKPGGRVVFVDYHLPRPWHPLRYFMRPLLAWLEPFALDMWRHEIVDWIPADLQPARVTKQTFFGGLYQLVVCER